MRLKTIMFRDIKDVFLNSKEFGEMHRVDGERMAIIIEGGGLAERGWRHKDMEEGLHTRKLRFHVSARDYGRPPLIGRQMELDGEYYSVTGVGDEGGMYSISLEEIRQ